MKKRMLIAIAGPDGAGKTTLANFLADEFGLDKLAFATYLREACIAKGLVSREEAYAKPSSANCRAVLRAEGTLKKRAGMPIKFEQLLLKDWLESNKLGATIGDMRFLSEAKAVQKAGGLIFYLDKPISAEEIKLDSFSQLPQIKQLADLVMPQLPSPNWYALCKSLIQQYYEQ